MKTIFKEYPIYKKRDGGDWKYIDYIYAESFAEAKRQFAINMTNNNWEKSNDICWLSKEHIDIPGWYDMNASQIVANENDEPDYRASKMELFCSEKAIQKGFAYWNEDVYSWELKKK